MGASLLPLMMASTILSAGGQVAGGIAANNAAKYTAQQQEIAGSQGLAASQRTAFSETRRASLVGSRARAVAAASGAGATDPTVVNIEGDIAGQGEYNALSALYEGQEAKRTGDANAALTRFEGKQAKTAAFIGAGSTLLKGGTSLYDKYGGGGPPKVPNDYQGHGYTAFSDYG